METTQETLLYIEPPEKSQFIRALDVFVIGPLILRVAYRAKGLTWVERKALKMTGFGTIIYNGLNWWKNNQLQKAGVPTLVLDRTKNGVTSPRPPAQNLNLSQDI